LSEWREVAVARSKPTEKSIDDMMAAVLKEARANKKLPELLAAIMAKMREADPGAADAEVERLIDLIADSMPQEKRQKFLEELLAFVRPN
jgi:hypothetical protein